MEYLEIKIKTENKNFEALQALLSELDFESFADNEHDFSGYINAKKYRDNGTSEQINELKNLFDFEFSSLEIEDKNWNEEWEKNFQPIIVEDKCLIRASFHESNPNIKDEIVITPKMSFGTGHHSTTYMMVNQMYSVDFSNKDVLDMGCGTAVLAILAKKMGAQKTVGIDINEWAFENSIENCSINDQSTIEIVKGGAEKLTGYQNFDVILANINRNILLDDMKFYNSVLTIGGDIVFSGFYTQDNSLIIAEADKYNFNLIDQNEKENWSLLHFRKNK